MIDATVDASYAALQRDQARRVSAIRARETHSRRPAGTLATLPAEPPHIATQPALEVVRASPSVLVPSDGAVRDEVDDALSSLRLMRLGVVAAFVLIFILLWVRQRQRQ